MTVKFDLRVNSDAAKAYIKKVGDGVADDIIKTIDEAAAYAIAEIKIHLPKRTGNLRRQYRVMKPFKFVRLIQTSKSKYADTVEFGRNGGGRMVYPRPPRKFLTIPIKDSVLTPTKAQIRKPALKSLFLKLGKIGSKTKSGKLSKAGAKKRWDVMQEVGIVLAKKARMSTIKPGLHLTNKIIPRVNAVIGDKFGKFFQARLRKGG